MHNSFGGSPGQGGRQNALQTAAPPFEVARDTDLLDGAPDPSPQEGEVMTNMDQLRQKLERLETQNAFLMDRLVIAESNVESLLLMLAERGKRSNRPAAG